MNKILYRSRKALVIFLQVVLVITSFWAAFAVRYDFTIQPETLVFFYHLLLPLLAVKLIVFWRMGLFHGWWRYVSMADLIRIFQANVIASLVFLLYVFLVYRASLVPRTVLVLDWVFCFLSIGGVRFVTRAFRENYFPMSMRAHMPRSRMLIVGAGDAGQMIAREVRLNPDLHLEVVGYIDDDPAKHKQSFQGVPVLGKQRHIGQVCETRAIDEIVIAIPSASGKELRQIVEHCNAAGVKFKTLPGVGQLLDGRVSIQHVKSVELEDLLGRQAVRLDVDKIRSYLKGKRVLITGAGGSIGSELCRQVACFEPAKIVLFENAETPLFNIERELRAKFPAVPIVPIIGDIRFRALVEAIFDEFMPEVVFHAAAYKHVPMMECNPAEAANNNVRGTRILVDAAHQFVVRRFVMVSTDKAVNPTNIMGVTKRAAELYVQALSQRSRTQFVTVRFGNVLGSSGSVIPIFKEQIAKGGPVTVTHPEVTRFFMTIAEACQLVLQAGSMGRGGEVFLLDMGEPVQILKLAEELIRLSGHRPYEDIEILFTGLRPGEKLYEELLLSGEGVLPTSHEKIRVAQASLQDEARLVQQIEDLYQMIRQMDLVGVIDKLQEMVPEYQPEFPGPQKHPRRLELVKTPPEKADAG